MINLSSDYPGLDEAGAQEYACSPHSLLFIAEDPLQASLLSDRLNREGYSISAAHNADEACKLARERRFPVIIVDCKMDGWSDLNFLGRLVAQQTDRSYLIVRSVLGTHEERERSLSYGADDHVSKLLPMPELVARIETGFNVLARREGYRLKRLMRTCGAALGRDLDTEEWRVSAIRLHNEILHAVREKKPLSVFVVHVERRMAPREKPLLTVSQFVHLTSGLDSILKLNSDFALALDASDGLVRLLVVLRETNLETAQAIRRRLCATIAESSANESNGAVSEDSGVFPDCSIGLATVESWETATITNATEIVALAEQSMEKLTLPV